MSELSILLLQIAVVLAASHAAGRLARPLRQPPIIGEMIAGLMLGPSVLGSLWPRLYEFIFPSSSLAALQAVSQVGLVLFMFVVGLRVDAGHLRLARRTAAAVSATSIVIPLALGVLLGTAIHDRLAPAGVRILPFALFIGVAMSITAFPVLARILTDHGLLRTRIGTLAIACAAFDDVTGWLLLAVVSAATRAEGSGLGMQLMLFAMYLAVMIGIVRPALAWLARLRGPSFGTSVEDLAVVLLIAMLSAAATEAIGVHALFGAFCAGVIVPRGERIDEFMSERIEPITRTLFLPIFFALTGLRTSVQLISGALWWDAAIILGLAVLGKGAGSSITARMTGLGWRDAAILGVLLNTRGLIELVVLNVGLDLGILSPVLFSMMVLMALVTTFMTSPLLSWLRPTEAGEIKPAAVR